MRTRYLVGCDGAHSFVRKQAGIGFPGVTSSERPARPVLLDLTPDSALAGVAALWRHRVNLVAARLADPSTPASGLLIRPDGYVAWAAGPGEPDQTDALKQALRAWFGPPETAVVAMRDP